MTNILVAGGAGYIGSHTALALHEAGFTPVVYDDLRNGHAAFVRWGPLERGDLHDTDRLRAVMERHEVEAVVHFAALIEVGESVRDPLGFYHNNVCGTVSLLRAAHAAGVGRIVFSSTCATYGPPQEVPMTERHAQAPINPYGNTKLMVETLLRDLDRHGDMRHVVLRYFNAAGADPQGRIGEWHEPETHAVPLLIETALGRRGGFTLFGTDYPTRDGTCVRDYVHVCDLADAHVRAVRHLLRGGNSVSLNLGTGRGTTVRELIAAVEDATGRRLAVAQAERREGDAPELVADNSRAAAVLGWTPRHDLASIVETALFWHAGAPATAEAAE